MKSSQPWSDFINITQLVVWRINLNKGQARGRALETIIYRILVTEICFSCCNLLQCFIWNSARIKEGTMTECGEEWSYQRNSLQLLKRAS